MAQLIGGLSHLFIGVATILLVVQDVATMKTVCIIMVNVMNGVI